MNLILLIALVISGECGPVKHGCETAIATTMANRMTTCTISETLEAYYGMADRPTAEALRAAKTLVLNPETLRTEPWVYAYSDIDRRTHGWRRGDRLICGAGLCLHLTETWPGD